MITLLLNGVFCLGYRAFSAFIDDALEAAKAALSAMCICVALYLLLALYVVELALGVPVYSNGLICYSIAAGGAFIVNLIFWSSLIGRKKYLDVCLRFSAVRLLVKFLIGIIGFVAAVLPPILLVVLGRLFPLNN